MATGRVVVDCSYPPIARRYAYAGVTITVDGAAVPADWGATSLDLPPGRHLVEVGSRHLGRPAGVARTWVPAVAGRTTTVFYRAPFSPLLAGTIGPAPQRSRGLVVPVALAIAAALVVVLAVLVLVRVL